MISVSGDDQIVTLSILGEVFFRVINDAIGANRARDVQVPRTAYGGHLSAKGFGNLYCERTHAAARAVDENCLSRLNLSVIANTLKSRQSGNRDGSCSLERYVRRFRRQVIFRGANVLGECASADAENFIARPKLLYGCAHCFNTPSQVAADGFILGFTKSTAEYGKKDPGHCEAPPLECVDG